jgi:hypothetical protein
MTVFAYTRSEAINTYKRLKDLELHALRVDSLARENLRDGAVAGAGLDWPDRNARRLTKAYGDFKKRNDADPRGGSQLLHSVGVALSPKWITANGKLDPYDSKNPNNILLLNTAVAWVKSFAGDDAIVSARMDLDEQGCGWVDVYFAPIRQQKYKGRSKTKAVISVNKCLEEHALSHGYSKGSHYAALNTGWAKYAQKHLDPSIQRGNPKKYTGKEHLPPRLFKAEQEALKAVEIAEQEKASAEEQKVAYIKAGAELQASHNETTKALVDILEDPSLEELKPRPKNGAWDVPKSIAAKVRKPGVFVSELLKILDVFAIKMAELRVRLDAIRLRERMLDKIIGEVEAMRDRFTAEDIATVEEAKRLGEAP